MSRGLAGRAVVGIWDNTVKSEGSEGYSFIFFQYLPCVTVFQGKNLITALLTFILRSDFSHTQKKRIELALFAEKVQSKVE